MSLLFPRISMVLFAGLIAFSAGAAAQAQEQKPEDTPAVNPEDVTDGQVVSFVNAYIALEQMRKQFVERIEAAETQEAREALIAEADESGKQLVDQITGISASEYVGIAKAMSESEALRARVAARVQEIQQKKQPKTFSLPAQSE